MIIQRLWLKCNLFFFFSKEKLWFQQLIWTNNQTYSICIKISLINVFSMNCSLPTVNCMYNKREDPFLYKWFKLNDSVLNFQHLWSIPFQIHFCLDIVQIWLFSHVMKTTCSAVPLFCFLTWTVGILWIRKGVHINLKHIILNIFNIIKRRLPDDYQAKTKKEETDYIRCYI